MAAKIALVTDSTCNIPPDLARERHIYVTPLYVLWGEDTLRDGIDIMETDFYARLAKTNDIPKTSQASPQDFAAIYERAFEQEGADEVICATLSSDLSGTYSSAMQAKAMVKFPVHVIDTRQVSWSLGHAVLAGADARDAGASPFEVVQAIRDSAARQTLLFTIESLEFLHRGGRIGNARLLIGTALKFKPVLELRDGIVSSVDNVRTRRRAVEHMLKTAQERSQGRRVMRVSVIHADAEEEGRVLLEEAVALLHPDETHFSYATTVLGVHAGPGALGLICEWEA